MKSVVCSCFDWEVGLETSCGLFPMFSVTEGGSEKHRDLEDPQAAFLPVSGGIGEGREKQQRLHKLLMGLIAEICCSY